MAVPSRRLASLLREGRPAHSLVAFGRRGERTAADLTSHVAGLADAVAKSGHGPWLVHTADSYACAVALLALARAGSSAVLLPNLQPGTLARERAGAVGALLDAESEADLGALPRLDPLALRGLAGDDVGDLDRDALFAAFSTSGTTGERKRIQKALRHLDDEVAVLEATFGPGLRPSTRFLSTASHQHVYGLLWRVLWPLASGRPFCSDTFLHPEELLPGIDAAETTVIISTPAALARLASLEDAPDLAGRCLAIYSSGGPLPLATHEALERRLGVAPVEGFGSTETGGVAWRHRGESELWRPAKGVSVSATADGRLCVRSPLVSVGREVEGGLLAFEMGDLVQLEPDGSFRLLGRADRIVKVGEKRISLPEMESRLEAHPYVAAAALLPLAQGSVTRIHAAIVPSEAGWEQLRSEGRRAMAGALTSHLEDTWDPVARPRLWRYVEALPRDAQGKLSRESLAALFERPVVDPILESESRSEAWLQRRLRVPHDLAFLEGHFESAPIVAGVVQLRWVLEAAREWLGAPPRVRGIDALKFKQVLRPGQSFVLDLWRRDGRLDFRLSDGDREFASGRCRLQPEPG